MEGLLKCLRRPGARCASHSYPSQTCEDEKFYHDMQEVLTKQSLCQFKKTEIYFLDRYPRFLHFNFDDLVESLIIGH